MTISNITPNLFIAAANFVSSEETRYYLKGVYVQHAIGGGLLYTATDGHRLFHAHDAIASMDNENLIIGISKPKMPAAWLRPDRLIWSDGILHNDDKSLLLSAQEVDGSFPDYTRLIPEKASGETSHFNYQYLSDFQTVAKKCRFGSILVHHNGQSPSLITFQDATAIGVIMPLRIDSIKSDSPFMPAAIQ